MKKMKLQMKTQMKNKWKNISNLWLDANHITQIFAPRVTSILPCTLSHVFSPFVFMLNMSCLAACFDHGSWPAWAYSSGVAVIHTHFDRQIEVVRMVTEQSICRGPCNWFLNHLLWPQACPNFNPSSPSSGPCKSFAHNSVDIRPSVRVPIFSIFHVWLLSPATGKASWIPQVENVFAACLLLHWNSWCAVNTCKHVFVPTERSSG